ncbi:ribonuclease inhibitor-like isoform X1 [Styela clava]
MTEVMLQILHIFMRSAHAREKEKIEEILQKLMQMSFEGTKENRVIFTIKDLEKVKLSPLEVQDFVIKVPGKNMFNQHLMEGDHLMFFSHQIFQELLSALYISSMDSTTFRTFIETEIRDDHWEVVRRFLSGIILNPDIESSLITNLSSGARQDDKREVLRKFLAFQSSQKMKSYEELELFGTLYETNDTDLICSCIKNINFSNESFTTVGMHAMSSVMRRCSQLEFVRLQNCNLNAELVHILKSNLNGSSLKLNKLDVSGNMNLGTDGFRDIGLVVTQCQVKTFVAGDCNLTAEEIKAFKESTRDAKLNQLNVSDNYGLGTDGFGELGLVVSQCHVETFRARECGLAAEGMEAFKKNTRNAKLIDLDVSFNKKLETDGFGELGLVVTQCHVEALFAINCNLTAEKMEAFKENTPNAKLNDLDVSFNKNLGTDCFGKLGLVVTQCHVERFNARYCNLTAEGMEAFKENTPNAKIKFLNLSGNKVSRLGDEGLSTIREIVHQCQVETLAMMECDFNPDQLERFKTLIADTGVKFILQIESTG